jgi:hypothetical protein
MNDVVQIRRRSAALRANLFRPRPSSPLQPPPTPRPKPRVRADDSARRNIDSNRENNARDPNLKISNRESLRWVRAVNRLRDCPEIDSARSYHEPHSNRELEALFRAGSRLSIASAIAQKSIQPGEIGSGLMIQPGEIIDNRPSSTRQIATPSAGKTPANAKNTKWLPSFLLRLKRRPIVCFVRVTGDFNLTVLRLSEEEAKGNHNVTSASLDSKMLQDFESEDHESDTRADGGDNLDEGQSYNVLLKPVVGSPRRNPHKVFPATLRHGAFAVRSILADNLRPRFCGIQAQSCGPGRFSAGLQFARFGGGRRSQNEGRPYNCPVRPGKSGHMAAVSLPIASFSIRFSLREIRSTNDWRYVPNGTYSARPVVQTGSHRDSESANPELRGGKNVWIRAARNLIDNLFDRLAGAKSVRAESRSAVEFLAAPRAFAIISRQGREPFDARATALAVRLTLDQFQNGYANSAADKRAELSRPWLVCNFSFEQTGFGKPCNGMAGARQFLIASCSLRAAPPEILGGNRHA